MEVSSKEITIKGAVGFPTEIYFAIVDWLSKEGYTIKKVTDWLEIPPRSPFYEEMLRRKQTIEQNVGRVLSMISETRKDVELIRHDLRRLREVQDHFRERDEHVLKSDFVDLVDRYTGHLSLIDMAISGKFPTIVVDFYRIRGEEELRTADVSETEKAILRKKFRLYEYWKKYYGREIKDKVKMLEAELNSKLSSIKVLEEMLAPYAKAARRIRAAEAGYSGLDDPAMVEGYQTSVAGVELAAWRGISPTREFKYMPGERYDFYCFYDLIIKRTTLLVHGKETEAMQIKIKAHLLNRNEIEKKEEEIAKKERDIWHELQEMRGEKVEETVPEKTKAEKFGARLVEAMKELVGLAEFPLTPGTKKRLVRMIKEEEMGALWKFIKEKIGGLQL
jgi:hypothetical protein